MFFARPGAGSPVVSLKPGAFHETTPGSDQSVMSRKCGGVCELIALMNQPVQLTGECVDSCLNVTCSFLPGGCCNCHVRVTEQIDVALILAMYQIVQIHMMKRGAFTSDVADAAIVVQVDAHVPTVCVTKRVEFGEAAGGFRFSF